MGGFEKVEMGIGREMIRRGQEEKERKRGREGRVAVPMIEMEKDGLEVKSGRWNWKHSYPTYIVSSHYRRTGRVLHIESAYKRLGVRVLRSDRTCGM